jgi:integrase/recombinase XerD
MNDSPRKISPLRQRMLEEMRMRQLAPKTRDAYIRAVLHFTRFLGRSPDTATAEDLRATAAVGQPLTRAADHQ